MSRYHIELATPADDADLRRIMAETPMAGRIAVSFHREPSYFDAAVVDGSFRHIVAARHADSPIIHRAERQPRADISIRHARLEDLPTVLQFLEANGPRRQFFPRYTARDFFADNGGLKGLRPADMLLAFRNNRLAGMLAG